MKTNKLCLTAVAMMLTATLAGCNNNPAPAATTESKAETTSQAATSVAPVEPKTTGEKVAAASKMTLDELEAASKKEFTDNPNGTFKVVGLTSVLRSVATTVASKYDWLNYAYVDGKDTGNISVNNSYKDYALLQALETAENNYFADYALVQDARSFSSLIKDGILHNYVPSDAAALGIKEEDTLPLKGVHFNKLFYTNTNFEKVTGKKLYNIWQVAGSKEDPDHLSKVSFQNPATEQINMSFLVSALAPENEKRIADAYKKYYNKEYTGDDNYTSIGWKWVTEVVKNISYYHPSDGTAMKETQLKEGWQDGYVYYGAFAKMKDAVGKKYDVDLDNNGTIEAKEYKVTCGGVEYTYPSEFEVNAMGTVKWDWEIEGFNGFMYCMDSEVINNAQFPYTACLFARTMLLEDTYTKAIYNAKNPDAKGNPANQYGYYYPGTASKDFRYAKGDWTKEVHIAKEINENYEYLKNASFRTVNAILALIAA